MCCHFDNRTGSEVRFGMRIEPSITLEMLGYGQCPYKGEVFQGLKATSPLNDSSWSEDTSIQCPGMTTKHCWNCPLSHMVF